MLSPNTDMHSDEKLNLDKVVNTDEKWTKEFRWPEPILSIAEYFSPSSKLTSIFPLLKCMEWKRL
jgi:hypothetical protein